MFQLAGAFVLALLGAIFLGKENRRQSRGRQMGKQSFFVIR